MWQTTLSVFTSPDKSAAAGGRAGELSRHSLERASNRQLHVPQWRELSSRLGSLVCLEGKGQGYRVTSGLCVGWRLGSALHESLSILSSSP